jgi:hypothetical protein
MGEWLDRLGDFFKRLLTDKAFVASDDYQREGRDLIQHARSLSEDR